MIENGPDAHGWLSAGLARALGSMRALAAIALGKRGAGRLSSEQFPKGLHLPPGALAQIPIGASRIRCDRCW